MTTPAQLAGPHHLAALLATQHGVLSTRQASAIYSRGTLRWRIQDGMWQQPHPRAVVTHNGPLTEAQRLWVAVCAAPRGSALCSATAAELEGLNGFGDRVVHLAIRQGQRRPRISGVAVRWSTQLGPSAIQPVRMPPRTRIARSLVDMASDASTDRMARAVLLAGVQQRLVTTRALSAALSTRGPCFRHALIVEALGDADGGVHSVPEHDFSRLVRRRNLPQPARQRLLRRSDGRYYLDAEWEAYRVAAEIQGSHHRIGLQWDDDLERHNAVSAGGRCLLHFSSYSVRHRPDRVADVLHEALVTRGWRP